MPTIYQLFPCLQERLGHALHTDSSCDDLYKLGNITVPKWLSRVEKSSEYFFPFELEFYLATIGLLVHSSTRTQSKFHIGLWRTFAMVKSCQTGNQFPIKVGAQSCELLQVL